MYEYFKTIFKIMCVMYSQKNLIKLPRNYFKYLLNYLNM